LKRATAAAALLDMKGGIAALAASKVFEDAEERMDEASSDTLRGDAYCRHRR
jgi:hypothetical protein